MHGMNNVTFSLHAALTRWEASPFSLFVVAVLVAAGYWYLRADWLLAARGRRWPRQRTAAFLAGLVAVDLALQSPVATFTQTYFQAHVVQHLLLMVVAPPLLALGAPSTLLLQTASRRTKVAWLRVLRSRPFAVLTYPVVVWALYFGVMFVFFLSSLINVAMEHMALMDALNVLFLLGGCLYWWPMVGADPIVHWKMGYGARMVNVALGGPPEVILGLAILSARVPIASMYSLDSTHAGGALLWISTEIAVVIGFMPIFWQWSRSDEREGARATARTVGLQPALAAPSSAPTLAPTPADDRPLTHWEAMWLARTGSLPRSDTDGSTITHGPVRVAPAPDVDRSRPPVLRPPAKRVRQRRIKWVVGAVGGLAVLAVAGPAFFFHVVEGNPPARLSLPPALDAAGPLVAGPVTGTWRVSTGSQAGYRVDEILLGQHHTAVGRTSKVNGGVIISGTTVTAADFSVDLGSVKSDQPSRDAQFDGYIMKTYAHPNGNFRLTQPIQLGQIPPPGQIITAEATGQLTLRGTTRTVTFALKAERVGASLDINAEIPITFSLWHIPNPSFAVTEVGKTGVIEVLLRLTPQQP